VFGAGRRAGNPVQLEAAHFSSVLQLIDEECSRFFTDSGNMSSRRTIISFSFSVWTTLAKRLDFFYLFELLCNGNLFERPVKELQTADKRLALLQMAGKNKCYSKRPIKET
jgi:hypothetical protein